LDKLSDNEEQMSSAEGEIAPTEVTSAPLDPSLASPPPANLDNPSGGLPVGFPDLEYHADSLGDEGSLYPSIPQQNEKAAIRRAFEQGEYPYKSKLRKAVYEKNKIALQTELDRAFEGSALGERD